ncbi:fibronectin type III domain-containing protein [Adhaeribacter sp. BT258]|uniref:Fibronectin type III domain-containing protein n=1 Tax=Adhaeribacter terrigena TaxID=2793070 RepID=A0ABS1C535_9BACT|nr:fibronectin type III domain-containing protein [Adhaeribacter terrigena]MBK0404491.1 fibronectin type III domain-containing protein [Adhaeribacter terrigena]
MAKLLRNHFCKNGLVVKTLCFLFLNLAFAFSLQAQTVTVGAGDDEPNDPNLTHQPFGNFFSYERSAGIYLGTEIGTSGTISSIAWFLEATNSPAASVPTEIYLKQTAKTTFTGNEFAPTELSGATLVWSGNITSGQLVPGTWITINLTTPFVYSNASNLEVIVATNTNNISGGGTPTRLESNSNAKDFRVTNLGVTRFAYWQRDDAPPGTDGTNFNNLPFTSNYRPNIQLTFSGATQTCNAPTGLSATNITATSADLNFTASTTGAAGTYTIEYGPSGFTPGTGTVISGVTTSPRNVSGLSPNTAYQFYVTKNCGGTVGNSTTTGPVAFTTTAAPQTCDAPTNLTASNITATSATLNFTGSTTGATGTYTVQYGPVGFANGSGTTVSGPPYNVSGLTPGTTYDFTVQKNCSASGTSTFVRSQFTTTAAATCAAPTSVSGTGTGQTTAQVTFSGGDAGTSYTIEYGPSSTFPNGTTTTTASSSPANLTGLTAGTNYTFVVRTLCSNGVTSVNSPSGTFATSPAAQTCDAPTNLTATNITASSATLNFTGSSTGATGTYTVQYGPAGFANGSGTTVSGPPYNVSGLSPNTSYEFTVQKNCGANGTSSFVRAQFTTSPAAQTCDAPTNLTASNITSTSADLNFTPSTTGGTGTYTIEYGPSGFTLGTGTVISGVSTSPRNVSGLNPSTAYQFYVTKNCGGSIGNSTTAGPAAFSTTAAPVTCNDPTNLNATNITNTTADLAFSPSAGTGTYIVEYGVTGFTPGTGTIVNVSTSPASVSNLTANTTYQFYVTKNCGSGVTSNRVGPASFTTTNTQPLVCNAPTNLNATNIGNTTASLNFTPSFSGDTGTYTLEYGPSGFTPGNGTVVSGLTSSPYNASNLLPGVTYQFYVTKNCTGSNSSTAGPASFTTTVLPCATGTWLGITSTDWHTPSNWCNNTIPTSTTDVTIPAFTLFQPEITAAANTRNLTIDNGATLTLTSGVLTVNGIFTNNGSFNSNGDGSLAFPTSNPNGQTVGKPGVTTIFRNLTTGGGAVSLGGPVSIKELLTLNANLNTNGQTFTLLSQTGNHAMVVNNSGVVNGTTTVQRYINPGINQGPGYRHLSSPVTNATIGQLNDPGVNMVVNPAYNTNPTPGTTRPFPTVFRYNETRLTATNPDFTFGWESPSSLGDPMTPGIGFTINMLPTTLDVSGTLNNGNISVGPLTRGSTAKSGWHLLGNPYPAPIDWDQVTVPAGLDNAVYVFRSTGQYSGSYTSYVNGVGTPGTELIAVMQAFFVRVNSGAPTFTFNNSARLTTYDNPAVYRQSQPETRPIVSLSVQDNTGKGDQLHVYFQQGATATFDSEFDAFKLPNSGNVASFYSVAGNDMLSINGLPVSIPGTLIPLGGRVPQAGSYTITADQIINFKAKQDIFLEDRTTGTLHNLRQQGSYSFTTTQTDLTGRFFLRFGPATTTGITAIDLATEVLVYPNPNKGIFTISMPAFNESVTEAKLFNAIGQQVWQQNLKADNKPHIQETIRLNKLAAGVYTLRLETGAGPVTRKIVIE